MNFFFVIFSVKINADVFHSHSTSNFGRFVCFCWLRLFDRFGTKIHIFSNNIYFGVKTFLGTICREFIFSKELFFWVRFFLGKIFFG